MIEKFRNTRQGDKISIATVNKGLRNLQSILNYAVERGYLQKNPFDGNRKKLFIREPEKDIVPMTDDEFTSLLKACPDHRWRAVCCFGYYAGLRKSEIFSLTWDDIDHQNDVIYVRNKDGFKTKSRRNRKILIAPQITEALKELGTDFVYAKHQLKTNLIFVTVNGGKINNNIGRDFARIVRRAGLVNSQGRHRFTLHDLRRAFCTNLSVKASQKAAQILAGHSSPLTTSRYYIGANVEMMRNAIAGISSQKVS